MKVIYDDMTLNKFAAWSGAVETKEKILECGKGDEFDSLVEELYPDGLTNTELNDWLWFNEESIYELLGIPTDDEFAEESDEAGDE